MLQGKKILLGVSASIAAYKAALLVRLLVKAGAEVRVIMTPAAKDFITPLTLSTLSKNPVLSELKDQDQWANHVLLGRWADALLIAPASANTLAKMAHGDCDNLLLAVYLAASCPVLFAPAMDEDMWHHPATRNNIGKLLAYGHHQLPVEKGELASGLVGEGRMAEPETIVQFLNDFFSTPLKSLAGKKVLITAGPTHEPLDPVRFIGNHSSGKMGIALAVEMASRGAQVELVLGPTHLTPPDGCVHVTRVKTAQEMYEACRQYFPETDIAVLAAAVADYRPRQMALQKIKKQESLFTLELEKTTDILQSLGAIKKNGQLLVGFSLETTDGKAFALQKLAQKKADMIVLNTLQDAGAGFAHDTNKITIFDRNGREQSFPLKSKTAVAKDIVAAIIELAHA